MIRIFVYAALVLAAAWGFSWLADRPGEMMILWQGQRIEMSLMVAVSLFAAAFLLVVILWWLLRFVWTSPRSMTRYFRARKRDRGYQALSTGLIAAGAGNAPLALKMAERTRGLLSANQEPLIHLLEAQAALIKGDHDQARSKFEAMAEDPETRELGLRGLYVEARRLGADEAAEHYASQAVERAPYLPWASQAVLEYRTRAGDFDRALDLLAKQKASSSTGGKDTNRERAVLLTARAGARLEQDPKGARDDALQALRLAPALVPAAVIAAKAYFREDNLKRGSAVLEQVWKIEPHPELADIYVRARSGDSALDRLKRAERLESLKPDNPIALAAVSRAALEARLFDRARAAAEAALKRDPREGLLLLLADIEEAETGNQARVRHFISAALRAPRDPVWMADGVASPVWQPISPASGEIGSFVWRPPFDQRDAADPDRLLEDLPPVGEADAERPLELEMQLPEEKPSAGMEPETAAVDSARKDHASVPAQGSMMPPVAQEPAPETVQAERPRAEKAQQEATVVPFFGHPPDDPGVRKGAGAQEQEKKRKPLF